MITVWDTDSAFVHLIKTFLFTDFICEQWIEHVTTDLLYIRCQYKTKDNNQE